MEKEKFILPNSILLKQKTDEKENFEPLFDDRLYYSIH